MDICTMYSDIKVNLKALTYIPKYIAEKYIIFPFEIKEETLYMLTCNNIDIYLEELEFISGKSIEIVFVERNLVKKYIHKFYNKRETKQLIKYENIKENVCRKQNAIYENSEKYSTENTNQIRIMDYMIKDSIMKNASDIHIEPFENIVRIRQRIDGIVYKFMEIPYKIYDQILGRIKILSNMDTTEKRLPQDGKFKYTYDEKEYDIRVSTLPTINGEKIVLRILNKSNMNIKLDELGFDTTAVKSIKESLQKTKGLILVTGPTNSGKSSTVYAMLNELDKKHKNIITIEDPVEYSIKGVNQVNVNNKINFTFLKALKNILRQDPDIIMVGEIRDEETAQMAVRAAITGHLVITTLHTIDTSSAISRLIDMGIRPYLLVEAISLIVAQRLLRKICPYCKGHQNSGKENSKSHKIGCKNCNYTGFLGRTVVYEMINMDENIRNIILKDFNVSKLREYNIKKMKCDLKKNAFKLVDEGITSLSEVNIL